MHNVVLLPEGYHARPPTLEDAPAVAAMIADYERDVFGHTEMSEAWLLDDWTGVDLSEQAVVIIGPDGGIAASADILDRADVSFSIYGYVHPEQRGHGLENALIEWGESWARDHMPSEPDETPIIVQHYVPAGDERTRQWLVERGYEPVRAFYMMEMSLDEEPASPVWPEDITIRAFKPGQDERPTFKTVEESFQDHWGHTPGSYQGFLQATETDSFDPDLWFLAFDGDEVAGICLNKIIDGSGWVETLGVRRPWRGRGLGLALLQHSIGELYRREAPAVGLSVDAESLTGAPRIFERAGMRVKRSYVSHRKIVRSAETPGYTAG